MKPNKSSQQQTYGPLGGLTLEASAYQLVSKRFDFGPDSAVCRHLVQRTFAALEADERRQGIVRVAPFTLHLERRGTRLPVSLLNDQIVSQLVSAVPVGQVLRELREQTFKQLLKTDPSTSMDEMRRLLAPSDLLAAGGRVPRPAPRVKDIEQCRMDLARLRQVVSVPEALVPAAEQLADPPAAVVAQVGPAIEQEGRSPELARSLISHLAALRERFCPRFDELAPGQLVAVALDVRDRRMSRKMRLRTHVPVRLTLYHDAELAALERVGPRDRDAIDELLGQRAARLLTEAYCQGGLLSLTLVALLTHQSPARVGRLVDQFEARHRLILPTPGTIHDAGTKLTHKATVVQMHLSGMECKQIARETFHTEEAVDRYVDDFERALIAVGHGLPSHLLPRVLKLGKHVVKQYEELIAEHIGGIEEVRGLLLSRGIDVQQEAVG
jgi:hypothetical protein